MSDVLDRLQGRSEMEMRQFLEAEIPPRNLGAAECTVLLGVLRRMSEQDPESRRFGWWRAAAYEGLGEYGLAEHALLETDFGSEGRRFAGLTTLAELRRRRADFAGARQAAEEVLKKGGAKDVGVLGRAAEILAGAWEDEGECGAAKKSLLEAARFFQKSAETAADAARVWRRVAELELLTGNWSEAEEIATKTLATGREMMGAYAVLARLQRRRGVGGEDFLGRGTAVEGASAEEWLGLGIAAEEAGDLELAERAATAAGAGFQGRWSGRLVLLKGRIAWGKGDAAGTNEALRQVKAVVERGEAQPVLVESEKAQLAATIKLAANQTPAAMMGFNRAVQGYVKLGFGWEQAACHELMARTLEASGAHALAAGQAELADTLRARLRSASAEASAAPAAMRADGAQLVEIIDQLVAMRVSPEYAAREFGNLIEATFGRTPTTGVVEDGVFHLLAGNEETGRELLVYASGRKPIPADCPLFRFDFSGMEEQQLWIHLPGAMDEGMSGRMPILLPIFGLVVETARLRAAEAGRRPMELAASPSELGLIGNGEGIRRVAALIERMRLSKSEIPTLILGESGTGKDVTARAIHRTSPRKQEPFVAFNCAAVEKSLLLSELFGHVKGAFTGADRNSMGLVRTADKGTLFLDEIGDLPLDQQPALLRFLEQREVRPVGSNAVHQVDVRVIAATNRNLTRMIQEGSFREDLYHRLAGIVVSLPPLRERLEDLEALTHHFLKMAQAESRKSVQISQGAFEALRRHTWPGNVRELRQTIQRVVSLAANGGTMEESDLNIESVLGRAAGTGVSVRERTPAEGGTLNIQGLTLKDAVDKARIAAVRLALEETGCNVQKTAKILQIEPMTVYAICKKGGLKIAREVRAKKA